MRRCPRGHFTGRNTSRCPQCIPSSSVTFEVLPDAFGGMKGLAGVERTTARPSVRFVARIKRACAPLFRKWRKAHKAKEVARG